MLKKPANIEVLFIDAVHPEHNAMAGSSKARNGKSKQTAVVSV